MIRLIPLFLLFSCMGSEKDTDSQGSDTSQPSACEDNLDTGIEDCTYTSYYTTSCKSGVTGPKLAGCLPLTQASAYYLDDLYTFWSVDYQWQLIDGYEYLILDIDQIGEIHGYGNISPEEIHFRNGLTYKEE